ncbi:MAG: imidazole glycerol phosphate synthase subunit HisH [Anaerolineaceae bacterium]|nr:imidazole glycerol phosphate synthase subunit HisH [Anaerolineaceae bacterium]
MIALVDYGMGNMQSVFNALECVGAEVKVTSKPADLSAAAAIVVPGVGAFAEGMANLNRLGLVEALRGEVVERGKPLLGICLGMQFLATESLEGGGRTPGLGWIPGRVERLEPDDPKRFKVPHMGWNDVEVVGHCPLFKDIADSLIYYHVHSYHFCAERRYVAAVCRHGQEVVVAVQRDNIFGVQFHPEKSQGMGLKLLDNFCALSGAKDA